MTDPLRPNVLLGAFDLSDPEYTARRERRFRSHWESATPLCAAELPAE